jgi:uncharacterized 2Fe-2S/4Fe-4S cluster protein (DUF4445 family)
VISVDGTIRPSTPTGATSRRVVANGRTCSYRLWDDPVVEVTQNDVRAIQLAKAALQAGCRLLMDHLGITEPDEIRLTGAFGSHIDPVYAMVLGLVPDCDLDRVLSVGNSAGRGSLMALLSGSSRRDVEAVTSWIEKVETAVEPAFQEHFVGAMGFPHTSVPYPHLSDRVSLPVVDATDRGRRRGGRRGRSAEGARL